MMFKNEKKYPVKLVNNKIIPTEDVKNEDLKEKLKTSNYFLNMVNLRV